MNSKQTSYIINLRVIPNSSKNELIKDGAILKLKLTAQPIENKANKAVIDFLSKHFRVPKSKIEILKGHACKQKKILINSEINTNQIDLEN